MTRLRLFLRERHLLHKEYPPTLRRETLLGQLATLLKSALNR
jgi:hypothetical protein